VAAPVFAQVASDHLGHLGFNTRPEPIVAEPDPVKLAAAERFAGAKADEARRLAEARADAQAKLDAKAKADATALAQAQARERAQSLAREQARANANRATLAHAPAAAPAVVAPLPPVGAGPAAVEPTSLATQAPRSGHRERPVLVPDLLGTAVDRATRIAAEEDLDVRVVGQGTTNGDGWVVSQQPRPGTIIVGADRTVEIELAAAPGGMRR
jgi:hypothetical protein